MINFLISILFISSLLQSALPSDSYCAFCDEKVLENQKFYEDEYAIALYTHKPMVPGHCLIIPKRHVSRLEFVDEEESMHLQRTLKKVHQAAMEVFGVTDYVIVQKNGKNAGQTVPHVHFHYIPRSTHSGLRFFLDMTTANIKSPLPASKMREVVEKMRHSIERIDSFYNE